ncbi:ABC transporter ATP-binding protein [Patulibacter defluvii]|uniref:ABC transporter ATP-binding protein n=1 Tax=Patulibacter defluvii TaxID=3095358 RepID=UPI002A75BE49|nr:oligopeptide/dipeptide ABC transporter ATP-binding protein [Patulibacter sp. DM4]
MTELRVHDVRQRFPIRGGLLGRTVGHVHAIDRADVGVAGGRTLGLVGESGCGKTTLGRIMVRLLDPTEGRVELDGVDVQSLDRRAWAALRPKVQMVFQDTQSSLDPRLTVEQAVAEPLRVNGLARGEQVHERVAELVGRCGLGREHLQRYPHELSGGQRQRVVIARALATEPDVIVLDEPTSALDVSVQAQILNLLKDLQDELGLTYVFISHDLGVVRTMSDEVAVMYLGEIVEHGPAERVFRDPAHPYTQLLLRSMPRPDPTRRRTRAAVATSAVPRADAPPEGCRFHPRCPHADARCSAASPPLRAVADRDVACLRVEELRAEEED